MNTNKTTLHLLIFLSPICLSSCVTVGIEKAKYKVIETEGSF